MGLIKKNKIIESNVRKIENKFDYVALEEKARNIVIPEEKADDFVDSSLDEKDELENLSVPIEEESSSLPRIVADDIKKDNGYDLKLSKLKDEYEKLVKEMDDLKQDTKKQVESMIKNAEKEADNLKLDSKNSGYKEGFDSAYSEYSAKSSELLSIIGDLVSEKKKIFTGSEKELLNLSVKIAEQLIKSEISYNQGVILNIVTEAIAKITDRDKVIVRVSRQDYEYVQNNRNRIMNLMDDIKNLVVQEDSAIDAGGCIIETELGYIDSRISLKLDVIKAALNKSYTDLHFDDVLSERDVETHNINDVAVNEESVLKHEVNMFHESSGEEVIIDGKSDNDSDIYDVPDEHIKEEAPLKKEVGDLFNDDAFDDDDDDFFDFDDDDDDDDFWS